MAAALAVLSLSAASALLVSPGRVGVEPLLSSRTSRSASITLAAAPTLTPLYDFTGGNAASTAEQFERIDDVIMGGVSSSRLVAGADAALFEGTVRTQGGGFAGTRLRLLAEPLDLSASDGLYLDCEADEFAARRVYKVAMRTKQDRGEVVYQARFFCFLFNAFLPYVAHPFLPYVQKINVLFLSF